MNVTKQELDALREELMSARMEYDKLITRYSTMKELFETEMKDAAVQAYRQDPSLTPNEFINNYYNQGEVNT